MQANQAPRSCSIHDSVARDSVVSEFSGSISGCDAIDPDAYSEDDDTGPVGMQCLPTLSRSVSLACFARTQLVLESLALV
jgi:hypothetical protein